ncbi:hypothetical protein ACFY3U_12000 [Micromonospora sp. NPDC000089]|uniref:hypothetical protein n=1 Tax=unclassified Micromonospora TaxID=2617518 RepID=UPI0036B73ECE
MAGDVVRQAGRGTDRLRSGQFWWQVLRVVLVLGWVAWAASTWWSAPRPASSAQAGADLDAGRMVSYQWAEGWNSDGDWGWTEKRTARSNGRSGPLFVWRTGDWRVHYADFDRDPTYPVSPEPDAATPDPATPDPATPDSDDGTTYSGPQAAAFDERLRTADPEAFWQGPQEPALVRGLPTLLLLGVLVTLVLGPAPVRGTRWFWFWVLTGGPLGLGVLWWLARERPWTAAQPPPPTPNGREPRDRWYVGLLGAVAASLVASLLLYGLRQLVGDGLVPPAAGSS